ncbi:hypothetical protein SAMN02745163_02881 [Clostridium cavendishii DSM 21758]|uniref:Uncharacterized protein n=1 Tax=Clostridium cavendishii DSM 21758 TaxID=1121302 RepID=A0A1M6NE72_9CLOT|nr:hypothetical protein [Clostridium cavendishii]SHJ94015.1 hypothetical protein SAMN02745163_02881 [Clostridium cavendishii DSM 21758]
MAKLDKPINVIVKGEFNEKLQDAYTKRLAIALYAQFGREKCLAIVENLKNQKE